MTRIRVERSLRIGEFVQVEDDVRHHLLNVLRLKVGERLTLVDASGVSWMGRITQVDPLELEVLTQDDSPSANPDGRLEVWVPLLKGGKTDDLVRQLTELGASAIRCYVASRSVARLEASKVEKRVTRWQTIASEATRQCGRTDVPMVGFSPGLPASGSGVYLWEAEGAPAATALSEACGDGSLTLLIGPEGGLSKADADHLEALGWKSASLGARILRAETAVIAGATLSLVALKEKGYAALV